MPIPLTLNSVTYQYPKLGDENWGQDATNWAVGITQLVNSIDTLIDNTIVAGLFELGDGNVSTPSLRFQNSLTTGIYRVGADILGFSAAGVAAGQISSGGRLQWKDGTVALPAFSFSADTDTGMYRIGANQLGLATNGTVAISVDSGQDTTIHGDLIVLGNINLVDLTATGNMILGNADTDTLNIGAELISNIVPDVNNTYSLGLSGKRWSNVFTTLLNVSGTSTFNDLTVTGNTILGDADTDTLSIVSELISNIVPDVNNTYNLGSSSKRWATVFTQSLNVSGTSTFNDVTTSGNTTIGDADTDTLSIIADIISHVEPDVTNTYDLGTSAKRWRDIFAARNVYGLRLLAQNGSVGSPSISFENDDTLGIYRDSGSSMQLVSGGANRLQITNTQLTPTVPLKGPAGSVSDPTYSFSGDPNTGLYNIGADQLGISLGGVLNLDLSVSRLQTSTVIRNVDGSAAIPAYSFTSETDLGIYRIGAGLAALAEGGNNYVEWGSNYTKIQNFPLSVIAGSAAAPAITFTTDLDTGFYRSSANQIGITSAGVFRGEFRADGFYYNLPFYAEPGTPASASFTFFTDTNTGLYNPAADEWGLTAGGTLNLVGGLNSVQSRIAHGFIDGTAAIPGLFFNSDSNTGLFRSATDTLAFATAGLQAGSVDSTRKWTFAQTGDSVIHRVNGAMEFSSSGSLGVIQDPLRQSTLTDNTTGDVFTLLAANSNIIVLYSIVRGLGKETGQLIMSSDGTTVQVSGQASTVVDCGVSFSGDINAGNIRLRYTTTSTGANATMRYSYKRWGD